MTFEGRTYPMALAMLLLAAAPFAFAGCSSSAGGGNSTDGGTNPADVAFDARMDTDASPLDAARDDTGLIDAGEGVDAADDAATPDDAGFDAEVDAGIEAGFDANVPDEGIPDASVPDAGGDLDGGVSDTGPALPDPVLFVHGVNGDASNWNTMIGRFIADGWPADRLTAHTFSDPKYGCNVDNAATIKGWVSDILAKTGATRIDLVAHSMGSISSRYYMKNLGGAAAVRTYVTLGGMHHGLVSPCFSPKGMQCTWDELCGSRDFLTQLNQPPVTPGPAIWVSMYGTADKDVPNSSSQLDGAENIPFDGVEHDGANGLQEVEAVYLEVRRVLQY